VKTVSEIKEVIDDVLAGIVTDEDTYDAGYDIGYLNALNWVLGSDE
jgi:hypothetical protein